MYEKYTKSRLLFMLLFGIGLMLLFCRMLKPDQIFQTKENYEQAFHIEKTIVTSTSEVPKLKPHILEKRKQLSWVRMNMKFYAGSYRQKPGAKMQPVKRWWQR